MPISPEDFSAAIKLFDETTGALSAQVQRLEGVLARKQQELIEANHRLAAKVDELDRLRAWLELVMGAVSSGVVAVDVHGRVTTCNRAAELALAGELSRLIDADWRAAFPDAPAVRVLASGRAEPRRERRVRGPEGGHRTLEAAAAPLRAPDGALIGAVEVFEDITAVRSLQERVERADRLKQLGEMAAGVAHEIRNPLNGIEGFASLLARDLADGGGDPAKMRRFAEAVVGGVRELNRTVTGLLEFTRPRRLDRRAADPLALVRSCVELVRAESASRAGAALVGGEDPQPGPAVTLTDRWGEGSHVFDPSQLRQVLLNLVQNAVHAVVDHHAGGAGGNGTGRVMVTVERDDDGGLVFTVDDDGPGVPEDDRQRIFTPFFTTKSHGTGLGLAIAHTIAALHGGGITVDESPLGGARFRLAIP